MIILTDCIIIVLFRDDIVVLKSWDHDSRIVKIWYRDGPDITQTQHILLMVYYTLW